VVPVVLLIVGGCSEMVDPPARHITARNLCYNNLKAVDGAKLVWKEQHAKDATAEWNDLQPYLTSRLSCPSGGEYWLRTVAESSNCSVHGELP
jgi:hypothetical protein